MLQRKVDLLLILLRELIVAIDHLGVAARGLNEVVDLRRCDAAPEVVKNRRQSMNQICSPVLVLP